MSGEDDSQENLDEEQGQPADQPQGQPQGQPAAQGAPAGPGQPVQGQPVQQGPSLVDELQRPESMRWLKYNAVMFVTVGVGYAFAFLLFDSLLPGSGIGGGAGEGFTDEVFSQFISTMTTMISLIGGLSIGVLLAAINGSRIGREFQAEDNLVLANSFVGSTVGFLAMAILIAVLLASGSLGDFLVPLIGFAVGVGATGALAAYVVRRF